MSWTVSKSATDSGTQTALMGLCADLESLDIYLLLYDSTDSLGRGLAVEVSLYHVPA